MIMRALNQRLQQTKSLFSGKNLFFLQSADILFCSFPRSGSTWLRFILCNLISVQELTGQPIDFAKLNEIMVYYPGSDLSQRWPYQTMPRLVKTHWVYHPLFGKHRSLGIIRDPRDVMVSYYHYQQEWAGAKANTFQQFIRDKKFGLPAWFAHYNSWRDRWEFVVRYEKLRKETAQEVGRLLTHLNANYTAETLEAAIDRSDMRKVREDSSNPKPAKAGAQFARSGKSQQWVDYFSPTDLAYYHELAQQNHFNLYL